MGKLAAKIKSGEFIITAEYLPAVSADMAAAQKAVSECGDKVAAVNVADNPYGIVMCSMAGSSAALGAGVEPVYQLVTRDRNRIALQSDLLGAAAMGVENVLCLSGYHQILTDCPQSANVYDIDSIQLIAAIEAMNNDGLLLDGTKIEGDFSVTAGAAANPYMQPMELNVLRVAKKVEAGAKFIQTQGIFDVEAFGKWLEAVNDEGITDKCAILGGVHVLDSAEEARKLRERFTDFVIGDDIVERLEKAGDAKAQAKEGVGICAEIIGKMKDMKGLRGIHVISGGKEGSVNEILSAAGL